MAAGLAVVAFALGAFTAVDADTEYYWRVIGALPLMGVGMGLAMAPATEAIMGSLPKAKAGIGSAMNDVVRELGGTLGVAVLGSVVSTIRLGHRRRHVEAAPRRRRSGERQRGRGPRGRRSRWVAARAPS